ncbi:DsrE family protein [Thalassolituus hydrocarboniclasticus]|uniref:DsrE family protein n=1 Tax=Thalassolituus hydrocarboniclasticus TaxID=2742796 RepID=A0ABY6A4X6_9GAMM|nr:DsrE family protein [Thalassolituus hydrocarboniclasticus]UXD86177.1 DsrE family protein [Thalassolituus hydrocarboniclasticus]
MAVSRLVLLSSLLLVQPALAELVPLTEEPAAVSTEATSTPELPLEGIAPTAGQLQPGSKIQAVVKLHTAEELQALLTRAEELSRSVDYRNNEPVRLVLSGDEIAIFVRSSYRGNKALVDLAARLDAFNVVELKVCRSWMARNKVDVADLPAFLDPVTNGAEEVTRLQLEGYASF